MFRNAGVVRFLPNAMYLARASDLLMHAVDKVFSCIFGKTTTPDSEHVSYYKPIKSDSLRRKSRMKSRVIMNAVRWTEHPSNWII